MTLRRTFQMVVLVVALVVAWTAMGRGSEGGAAAGEDEGCFEPVVVEEDDFDRVEATPAPDGKEGRVIEAALVAEDPEGVVMRFGKDRGPLSRKFFVALPDRSKATLPEEGSLLNVRQRPLEREEADHVIGDDEYVVKASFTGAREVTVDVCVDPSVHPGTYKGQLTLEHPDIRPVVVPVEVSLQFSSWWILVVLVGGTVLFAGPAYVWATRRKSASEGGHVLISLAGLRELGSWVVANFIAFGIACIAATSAFLANYWYDPSWGAEAPKDWFTLIGATFTAFTTGMLTGTASPKGGQTTKDPAEA